MVIAILWSFPGFHQDQNNDDIKPDPDRRSLQSAIALSVFASLLGFLVIFWQHLGSAVSANLIEDVTYGMVQAKVGTNSLMLSWAAIAISTLGATGLIAMFWAISLIHSIVG